MATLTFKYGPMAAAKSLDLLVTCYQYEAAGKRPFLIKPSVDTRQPGLIWSRVPGMQRKADIEVGVSDVLDEFKIIKEHNVVLVDECHWLSTNLIRQLYNISKHIPVICYGLRTDFKQQLFPGSACLLSLADEIVEVKGLCRFCPNLGKHNFRVSSKPVPKDGSTFEPGADDTFVPACKFCFDVRNK